MKEFWKDYLLSFFSQKRAKNIYKRSFVITFIGVIVLFLTLFLSSFYSQEISFKTHLNKATDFKNLLNEILPEEEIIKDGKMSINYVYNSFQDDSNHYLDKGYHVIVDTRDAATTFDTFTFTMENEYGDKKSYDEYLALEESDKEGYSAVILRSGVPVDVIKNVNVYETYLNGLETSNEEYVNLKEKQNSISELEYANELYLIYGKAFYPEEVYTCDSYGGLPTIRTFNISNIYSLKEDDNFIFIYKEGIECSFKSGKHDINFFGEFENIDKLDLSKDKEEKINFLISSAYKQSIPLRIMAFLFFTFFIWFIFLLIYVALIIGFRVALSFIRKDERHYILKIMNLLSSFFPFACLFSGIIGLFLGFACSRTFILFFVPILIFIMITLRGAIYYICEKNPSDYIKEDDFKPEIPKF